MLVPPPPSVHIALLETRNVKGKDWTGKLERKGQDRIMIKERTE